MASYQAAVDLKQAGNACFSAGDFVGADKFYTQAIIKDPTNPAFFTNRALARLRMVQFDAVVADCAKALELMPTSLKAYSYLGQAHLALKHPNEALSASLRAYELAITQRSPSIPSIAATCLEAKKLRWESSERQRIARESALLRDMCDLIEKDAHEAMARVHDRSSSHEDDGEHGSLAAQEEIAAIEADACRRMRELEDVFGKAEANTLKRREVPDWAIDNITFGIMFDPVMTKSGHSYDRATLMDHLRRSQTDPLTREPLTEADLRPNLALKAACEEFLRENGWAVDY